MSASFGSKLDGEAAALSSALTRWFPMPSLLMPAAAGIDISDSSLKWIVLIRTEQGIRVQSHGEVTLQPGIVVAGVVQNVPALVAALREVRKHLGGVHAAHGALPEEAAYIFSMTIPHGTPREQALSMIEFEFEGRVPIAPAAAVYDYSPITTHAGEHDEISVVVYPKEIAETYAAVFEQAGVALLSLEVEARSIARAISSEAADEPVTLIVDYGRARTGFAVLKRGVPIFSSTVPVGGDAVMRALVENAHLAPEQAERFKEEQGLDATPEFAAAREAIIPAVTALAVEIAKHYRYWDTRRNDQGDRMTPVGKVLVVGGNANLKGLTDFIAAKAQADVSLGEAWRHVTDFSTYIPPIDRHRSLQYATAIGLALRAL